MRVLVMSIAFCALVLACLSSAGEGDSPSADTATGTDNTEGGKIFVANCAVCHGAEGRGEPDWHIVKADGTLPAPPLNGDGHTWHHSDGFLYRMVSRGGAILESPVVPDFRSGMPAFGDQLNHDELIAVLTYVKGLWAGKTSRGFSIEESQGLVSESDPFPERGA